jgi:hypothetical protein
VPVRALGSVTIAGSVISIGNGAFQDCVALTRLTIGDGVTSIGENAFAGYGVGEGAFGRASVTIPDSVTNIGNAAFQGCSLIGRVTIGNGVTSIGDDTFEGSGLTNVTIPDSVTNIGATAFNNTYLDSVTIPGSVTSIGEGAFDNILYLTSVFFTGDAPTVGANAFWEGYSTPIAYYLPGTTGGSAFSSNTSIASVLWNPVVQTGGASFGVQNNQFGFTITNSSTSNIPIVVEACTNLASPVWVPLQTITLSNSFYFSDPDWTNYSARFYSLSFP